MEEKDLPLMGESGRGDSKSAQPKELSKEEAVAPWGSLVPGHGQWVVAIG